MKMIKMMLIFLLLAYALLGVVWIAGIIDSETAKAVLGRASGIIILLGVCFQLIASIARKSNRTKDSIQSDQSGPKF
jgi:hypothetical protein